MSSQSTDNDNYWDDISENVTEEAQNSNSHVEKNVNLENLSKLIGDHDIPSLQGKDVALIIGKTGVGKSSFIQFIHGVKFIRDSKQSSKYIAAEPDRLLPDFPIGSKTISTTKCIRSYETSSGLVFCDTPGFKDTDEYNIDIATCLWITKIAKICKSLRIVLLVNIASLDEARGEPFRELLSTVAGLVNHQYDELSKSLMMLFTHASDLFDIEMNEKNILKPLVKKSLETLIDKEDTKPLASALRHMAKEWSIRVFNLIDSNKEKYLEKISKLQPLSNPADNLKVSLTKEVSHAASIAMFELKDSIQVANDEQLLRLLSLTTELSMILGSDPKYHVDKNLSIALARILQRVQDLQKRVHASVSKVCLAPPFQDVTKEELQQLIPLLDQLKCFSKALESKVAEGENPPFQAISLEYWRRRFLLALSVHIAVRTEPDYKIVARLIQYARVLDVWKDMFASDKSLFSEQCLSSIVGAIVEAMQDLGERLQEISIPSNEDLAEQVLTVLRTTQLSTESSLLCQLVLLEVRDKLSLSDLQNAGQYSSLLQAAERDVLNSIYPQEADELIEVVKQRLDKHSSRLTEIMNTKEYGFEEFQRCDFMALKELYQCCSFGEGIVSMNWRAAVELQINQFDAFCSHQANKRFIADAMVMKMFQRKPSRDHSLLHGLYTLLVTEDAPLEPWEHTASTIKDLHSQLERNAIKQAQLHAQEGYDAYKRKDYAQLEVISSTIDWIKSNVSDEMPGYPAMLEEFQVGLDKIMDDIDDCLNRLLCIVRDDPVQPDDFQDMKVESTEKLFHDLIELKAIDEYGNVNVNWKGEVVSSALNEEQAIEVQLFILSRQIVDVDSFFKTLLALKQLQWMDRHRTHGMSLQEGYALLQIGCESYLQRVYQQIEKLQGDDLLDHKVMDVSLSALHKFVMKYELAFDCSIECDSKRRVTSHLTKVYGDFCRDLLSPLLRDPALELEEKLLEYFRAHKVEQTIKALPLQGGSRIHRFRSTWSEPIKIYYPELVQEIESILKQSISDLLQAVEALCSTASEHETVDLTDLARIQIALQEEDYKCFRVPAQQIFNYRDSGKTFLDYCSHELDTIAAKLHSPHANIDSALEQLESYRAITHYMPDNKVEEIYQAVLMARSDADEEIKALIQKQDFSNIRQYLDQYNDQDNAVMHKRYQDVMQLLCSTLRASIEMVRRDIKCGDRVAREYDMLRNAAKEVGSHVQAFSGGMDLQAEIDRLKSRIAEYLDMTCQSLDTPPIYRQIKKKIDCADALYRYCDVMGDRIEVSCRQKVEQVVEDHVITVFFSEEPLRARSLYRRVEEMMQAWIYSTAWKKTTSDEMLTASSLGVILEDLQQLQGCLISNSYLSELTSYETVKERIAKIISRELDSMDQNNTPISVLLTLQHIEKKLTDPLAPHFDHMFDLPARVKNAEKRNMEFTASIDTELQKEATCKSLRDQLDQLKSKRYSTKAYKDLVSKLTSVVNRVTQTLDKAIEQSNLKHAEDNYLGLYTAKATLGTHLKVPLEKYSSLIKKRLEEAYEECIQSAVTKEFTRMKEAIGRLSFCLELWLRINNKDSKSPNPSQCLKLHTELSKALTAIHKEFNDAYEKLNMDKLIETRQQLHAWAQVMTNKSFAQYKKAVFSVGKKPYGLDSLNALTKQWAKLPKSGAIAKKINALPQKIVEKVQEANNHSEYYRWRSPLEALQQLLTSNDLFPGKNKQKIQQAQQDVKKEIEQRLQSIQYDIRKHCSSHNWLELNKSQTFLAEADKVLQQYPDYAHYFELNNISGYLEEHIRKCGDSAIAAATSTVGSDQERIRDCAIIIIALGKIYDALQDPQKLAQKQISRVLRHCSDAMGVRFIFNLGSMLSGEGVAEGDEAEVNEARRIGRRIAADFSAFKDVNILQWNQRVAQHDVHQSLLHMTTYTYHSESRSLKPFDLNKSELARMYDQYKERYEALVKEYLGRSSEQLAGIVEIVRASIKKMTPCSLQSWGTARLREELPIVLAGLFTYFTIMKSGDSYQQLTQSGDAGPDVEKILLMPHNVQIISILQLLGCGGNSANRQHSTRRLCNQLMQIGTGEGKSIILGALSTLLALLGFEVRCVCYSEYLSQRDFDEFKELFEAFDCKQYITYSTITKFSEDLVSQEGNIRQLTRDLLQTGLKKSKGNGKSSNSQPPRKQILLVDEVDVFFGKDFYGQTYNQVTEISCKDIQSLIRYVWGQRRNRPTLAALQVRKDYKNILQKYKKWESIINRELQLMCAQVASFDKIRYEYNAQLDKIGYIDHDSISYSKSYGYCTVFAYLNELDKGNVLSCHHAKFEDHLALQISCGQFSYANINPACILGVSGTIEALSEYEREVMHRYDIDLYTIAPSVYGKKELVFDQADTGIYVADSAADYFKAITNTINRISRTSDQRRTKERAIIVFFESIQRLKEFRDSTYYHQIIEHTSVNILTEDTKAEDRDHIIKRAATIGQVTLATRIFGRGTDFISYDNILNNKGGVHILQTFLSEMHSEEIQVQGRTARQGQKGSYGLVLLMQDAKITGPNGQESVRTDTLEYFGIQSATFNAVARAQRYETLKASRDAHRLKDQRAIETSLSKAKERDTQSHKYLKELLQRDEMKAMRALHDLYNMIKGDQCAALHFVFVLDASGSMKGTPFEELRGAYNEFIAKRQSPQSRDHVSVIMFSTDCTTPAKCVPISKAPKDLELIGQSTVFSKALSQAKDCIAEGLRSKQDLQPAIIFMTDGQCHDIELAVQKMREINSKYADIPVHLVAFGNDEAAMPSLLRLQKCVSAGNGHIHRAKIGELQAKFMEIEQSLSPEYK